MNNITRLLLSTVFFIYPFVTQAKPVSWNTKVFKIIQHAPGKSNSSKDEGILQGKRNNGLALGLTSGQVETLETYMNAVAIEYQRLGFKEPTLTHKTKSNEFKIFVHNYSDDDPIAYFATDYRSDPFIGNYIEHVLAIDSSRTNTSSLGGPLELKVYSDLAHEIFHAIQASYPLFKKHTKLGDWIVEGTATAIGQDIAVKYSDFKMNDGEWGMRPYIRPLRVPDLGAKNKGKYTTQEGHSTAGLWRYIGEYISNRHKPSSKQKNKADYRYLVRLFKTKLKKVGENRELNWLDRGLRKDRRIKTGLNGIYSSFISTFIHYSPDRFGKNADEGITNWHKCLFSGFDCKDEYGIRDWIPDPCDEHTIIPGKELEITLRLPKVASRCFKLINKVGNRWDVEVGMELAPSDLKQLNKLWIGTKVIKNNKTAFDVNPGVTPEYSTNSSSSATSSAGFTSWSFELTSLPQIFVVSNIAEKPSDTEEGFFTLKIAIPSIK